MALTIQDAMTVVRRLGKTISMGWQVLHPTAQYWRETCDDPEHGPDIWVFGNDYCRSPWRWWYSRLLISTLPSIRSLILESRWATGGWTYQEARMSRCCLFFTDTEVYFVYRTNTVNDSVRLHPTESSMLNSARLNEDLFRDYNSIANGVFRGRFLATCFDISIRCSRYVSGNFGGRMCCNWPRFGVSLEGSVCLTGIVISARRGRISWTGPAEWRE